MFDYSKKLLAHFQNPKNYGRMENPDGIGKEGNPVCVTPNTLVQTNDEMIEIKKKGADEFLVIVTEADSKTEHNVALNDAYYQRLIQGKIPKEELIKKSFQFLLKREPKESILSKFDLRIIKEYFVEYEEKMKRGFNVEE